MLGFKNYWKREKKGRCPRCDSVTAHGQRELEKFLLDGPPTMPSTGANKDVLWAWIKASNSLLCILHKVLMSTIVNELVKHETTEEKGKPEV